MLFEIKAQIMVSFKSADIFLQSQFTIALGGFRLGNIKINLGRKNSTYIWRSMEQVTHYFLDVHVSVIL